MKNLIILSIILFVYITPVWADYAPKEIEIAKTIAMEACGEGKLGMIGVANVIRNRSELWDMTPYEVISAPYQFVGFTNSNRDKRFNECKEYSLYLAKNLMSIKDRTDGALYFKRLEEKRRVWHKNVTVVINNHEFWK